MMKRQRKPRINLTGFENDYVVIEDVGAPNKWLGRCKSCGKIHEQTSREIQRNQSPMSCLNYKPHNWTGFERDDAIIRRQYGISMQEFNKLLEHQGGGCAICLKPIESLRRRMNIDHCHETNVVRGILCSGCNTGLGHLGDNLDGLQRALDYLLNPPFQQYALAR